MKMLAKRWMAGTVAVVTVAGLAACATGDADSDGTVDGPVTISVGGMPTTERPEERAFFQNRIEEFEKANPDITIEGEETRYDVNTFNALLAGGGLPTLINVPFTEMQGLISRQQVLDVTPYTSESEVLSQLNPRVQEVVSSDDKIYGVPWTAYTMSLLYNRDLFAAAGLDPDAPPTTWDEVREAAVAITESTDAQGFGSMTTENAGGWAAATMAYSFGGLVENEEGTEATVDTDAMREVLEFYQTLRWEDNVFGDNFLLNYDDASQQFAAGNIGMFLQGSDAYPRMVDSLGMTPDSVGIAPLPQESNGLGTLAGGTVAVITPTATEAEAAAAIKWIEFHRFEKYSSEEAARAEAEAGVAEGVTVGSPESPVVDEAVYATYLSWIDDLINVPRENFTVFLDSVETLPLVPEPATKAQEVYALLDPVVQAVLTREDADIPALLESAQSAAQSAIDAG
ncbi:ABC transporter substrate-binding protein [Labedella endophytica]|uniref:Extracellular solute-binding protein n=1 Tax=Labedella endophytica TaxID=1523160 RepID=A0A3S0VIR3_9MICO|nr:extracellular solute-binding protein [Labedella endophytica]RUR03506.1 extracellular solute-binding protein [Labedella endophytica]